ncbi:Putative DNA-binding domain-containing protein [Rhodovulum sp. ES.010]|uniref:HvfC/BufC N-terminal domain-containing protein n=1 Tax=Rhodovulum sp. ES.010 TaxID=1882821 RepID=UPI000925FC6E|nr:DNA-binding domain-containing protein [Rhodovulum sp. ES.010]SIO01585.1 Putative DNA-binding domain-containing protein [Rhodovulum sp. ES.010]
MSGQDVFAAALLQPDRTPPAGLMGRDGAPAGRRFDVYRNNVIASLIDALGTGFPVVRALLGARFFGAMAGAFVRAHPPRAPRLTLYGDALPGFLEGFAPVAHLGYLPDVARLELALRQSYHAADATPLAPGRLAALPPGALATLRLDFVPALRLLRSDWPVHDIWHAHHGGPKPGAGPQEVLIARPGFDPAPHLLPPGGHDLLTALIAGAPLGQAMDTPHGGFPETHLSTLLQVLLDTGAICGISPETPP